MRKKLLYYFDNYRYIVTKISINEISDIDINSSIPFAMSDIDPMDSYNILKNIPNTNIHNDIYIPKSNTSIAYSFISENNPHFGNVTERINNRNILDKKNLKKRRTMSYGNLEVKLKKDNEDFKVFDNDNNKFNNGNIFNNSNIINDNTQQLKYLFPPYTFTTPNKYVYPIILNNNSNTGMNNNLSYQYPRNTVVYQSDLKDDAQKPLLWYTNVYPSISQISIMQDNNYLSGFQNQTPRYINNSAYFNSITNINNSYSEDYLNKQIFDFINANSKTKKIIISNIGKKHNIKLSRTKKINDKKTKSKEKTEKNKKDKSLYKNRNKQIIYEKMKNKTHSEYNDLNSESFQNEDFVINKYKRNQKLKIDKNSISYNLKNKIPSGQKKKSIINNLKSKNINLDRNKIIKNYSIEISNSEQIINNNDYIYEKDSKTNHSINFYNRNDINKENQYSYKFNEGNSNFNENTYNINNSRNNVEEEQNNIYDESLRTSIQSINDSKMMEMANHFVEEDKIVNKDKINEILNEKNSQRYIKLNK